MSLRKVFRSRKFSRSFKEVRALDDSAAGDRIDAAGEESEVGNAWSTMLPEILGEIIRRVDAAEEQWPHRQNVVACACVCKRWRDTTREIVRSPSHNGRITFPSCLKQVLLQNIRSLSLSLSLICFLPSPRTTFLIDALSLNNLHASKKNWILFGNYGSTR